MMCTLIFNCNNARAYLQSRYRCISKYMTKNYISRSAKTTFNLEHNEYYIGTNYIYTRQLSGTEWDQWLINKLNLYHFLQINIFFKLNILQIKQIKFISEVPIEWSITISLFIPNTRNKRNYIRPSNTTRTNNLLPN